MRRFFVSLIGLLFVVSLVGCGGIGMGGDADLQEVTIAMGYIPNVQFTPVYVALERGYFSEQGIDLKLDYGMETDLLQRLGKGEVSFAIASGDQVVLARSNGLPVTYVANWYRRFPVCIVSLQDAGIETPEDLVGKTVGIPALEGASYIGWQAFLDEVGIAPEKVDLQVIGYTQVASLTEGRVDAVVCYAMNEPVQLREAGYDVNAFYLDKYTSLVSNGLITNDDMIAEHPDLVEGMVTALLRGIDDTLTDPDAAFAITREQIEEMDDENAVLQRAVLTECLLFWEAEQLGYSLSEDWESSVQLLTELGMVSNPPQPQDLFTNEFVE